MVINIMISHFPALGSGVVLPLPPTILMSASQTKNRSWYTDNYAGATNSANNFVVRNISGYHTFIKKISGNRYVKVDHSETGR